MRYLGFGEVGIIRSARRMIDSRSGRRCIVFGNSWEDLLAKFRAGSAPACLDTVVDRARQRWREEAWWGELVVGCLLFMQDPRSTAASMKFQCVGF